MTLSNVTHKVNLVDGVFTPAEASKIILRLLQEKINFHRNERFQQWIGDCTCDDKATTSRIKELETEKQRVKAYFEEAAEAGTNISMNGILNLEYV